MSRLIKCHSCSQYYGKRKKSCPNCFSATPLNAETKQKPDQKKRLAQLITTSLFALVGIAIYTMLIKPVVKDKSSSLLNEVYVVSQYHVEQSLKSPSSAKFQPFKKALVNEVESDTYIVKSWVEGKNSFNAPIRKDFVCKLVYRDDKSKLLYLNFE